MFFFFFCFSFSSFPFLWLCLESVSQILQTRIMRHELHVGSAKACPGSFLVCEGSDHAGTILCQKYPNQIPLRLLKKKQLYAPFFNCSNPLATAPSARGKGTKSNQL
uniref:Secreted protein n=1 Tax=Physcomitrium patens TaxID=3218 RepID=A0A2K1L7P9_PHYPA|nr:hypothetical protein PHYPA_000499 [Physcomitrium patens]